MSKRAIVDRCLFGLAAFVPGFVLTFSASLTLAARRPAKVADLYGRTMLVLLTAGAMFILVGALLELLAWIGALSHASAVADSQWSPVLLWGGILGILTLPLLGVGVMIFGSVMTAYLVVAPNQPQVDPRATTPGKPLITRWGTRGWVITGIGMMLALAVPNLLTNPGRPLHGALWPSLALIATFWAVAGIGAVVVGVAWWGAVFNSYQLADKTWFRRLRWTGILGVLTLPLLGLGALILLSVFTAYARLAPDGTAAPTEPPASSTAAPGQQTL